MDLGQMVKDGFKKVSEAAMDAVVTSIVSNQEQHLHRLQDMQKWGIVKIAQRFTSHKYLHLSPCVKPVPDISLMDILGDSKSPNVLHRPQLCPVGSLHLLVEHAKLLLLGHPLTSNDSTMKKFEWKVKLSCDRNTTETKSSVMSRDSQTTSYAWLPEAGKAAELYTPLHEVHWNETLIIENVGDLWSDICISVYWRKETDQTEKQGTKATAKKNVSTQGLSFLGFPGVPDHKADDVASNDSTNEQSDGKGTKPPLRSDTHPARRKSPPEGHWGLYGRAIIPLSTFLASYGSLVKTKQGLSSAAKACPCVQSLYWMENDGNDVASFWVHLFPHESHELKFYKPVAGYTGFGMSNPGTTLGFLKVRVQFVLACSPLLAPLVSVLNPPATHWTNSINFEPQYLETYGLRTRHLLTTYPRWVPKFLHLLAPNDSVKRNFAEKLCILSFWLCFFYASLFAPLVIIPLCLFVCLASVSLSYRVGDQAQPSARDAILYRRHRKRGHECPQPHTPKGIPHSSDPIDVTHAQSAYSPNRFLDTFDVIPPQSRDVSSITHPELSSQNVGAHQRQIEAADTSSIKLQSPKSSLNAQLDGTNEGSEASSQNNLSNLGTFGIGDSGLSTDFIGQEGTQKLESIILPSSFGNGPPLNFSTESADKLHRNWLKADKRTEESLTPRCSMSPLEQRNVSIVDSPFGPLTLSVNDPSSYCSSFPVFADDAGEQDLQALLENGLEMLDGVQRLSGAFSYFMERLKFAFNWEDSFLTVTSYVIVFLMCLSFTTIIFVGSFVPLWMRRLPMLLPLIAFITITDPYIQKKFWMDHVGIDIPFLWLCIFSRARITKPKTSHEVCRPPTQSNADVVEDIPVHKKSETPPQKVVSSAATVDAFSAETSAPLCVDSPFKSSPKGGIKSTEQVPTPSAKSVVHFEPINFANTLRSSISQLFGGPKAIESVSLCSERIHYYSQAPSITCVQDVNVLHPSQEVAKVTSLLESNATNASLRRRPVPPAVEEQKVAPPPLKLIDVTATVVDLTPTQSGGSLHRSLIKFARHPQIALPYLLKALPYLRKVLVYPVSAFVYRLVILFLQFADVICRLLVYWWIRIPDRREIEHRQIAATQLVESLEQLMPFPDSFRGGPSPSSSKERKQHIKQFDPKSEEEAGARDLEDFLDSHFKRAYLSKNPISGLMNIRLMQGTTEFPKFADLSNFASIVAGKGCTSNPLNIRAMIEAESNMSSSRRVQHLQLPTVYPSGLCQRAYRQLDHDNSSKCKNAYLSTLHDVSEICSIEGEGLAERHKDFLPGTVRDFPTKSHECDARSDCKYASEKINLAGRINLAQDHSDHPPTAKWLKSLQTHCTNREFTVALSQQLLPPYLGQQLSSTVVSSNGDNISNPLGVEENERDKAATKPVHRQGMGTTRTLSCAGHRDTGSRISERAFGHCQTSCTAESRGFGRIFKQLTGRGEVANDALREKLL